MKLIKFIPFMEGKELVRPSVSKIPQWWKDGESTIFNSEPGLKSCIPFMEIMSSGYTINLPFDIFVANSYYFTFSFYPINYIIINYH